MVLRGCVGDDDAMITEELKKYASSCSSALNCNNETLSSEHCHNAVYSKMDLIDGIRMDDVKSCGVTLEPMGCYYRYDAAEETVKTGCVSDLSGEDPKTGLEICMGDECNQQYTFLTCLAHKQHDVSRLQVDDVKLKLCDSVDDCFTFIQNGTLVERGCQSDLLPQASDRCEDRKELCISCSDQIGCNRMGMVFVSELGDLQPENPVSVNGAVDEQQSTEDKQSSQEQEDPQGQRDPNGQQDPNGQRDSNGQQDPNGQQVPQKQEDPQEQKNHQNQQDPNGQQDPQEQKDPHGQQDPQDPPDHQQPAGGQPPRGQQPQQSPQQQTLPSQGTGDNELKIGLAPLIIVVVGGVTLAALCGFFAYKWISQRKANKNNAANESVENAA